jgi:F-type H+-transporting ATPase subunit delta
MQNPRLATRYAKSLLDLAVERNSVEDTLKDMQLLNSICEQSHDFVVMLRSPVISGDKKLNVVKKLLEGRNVSQLTQVFVNLLVSKGRESNLPEIAQTFQTQYNTLKNIRTVKLTTAAPITDGFKSTIQNKIAGFMPSDSIDLKMVVDEKLIGGFVIEVEDKLYDASVRKSLTDFKNKVIDKSYESKIG